MRRKRICRGSFPKGLCLRGVAGPFPPVGILLLEALPGAAPLHICSSPRALNPAFQTPGAREESGGGKIAAFRDEIPPPFRSQRHLAPRTGREAPGSAPLARNLLEEQPQGLDLAAPGALAAPGGLCLQGGSIPHSRGARGAPGLCGQDKQRAARSCWSIGDAAAAPAPGTAELPEGTARSGLEKRSCQEGQGKSKSARQGEGSDQRAPEAARQRWERSSRCLPGNGWMESGCLCGNHTDPRVSHPRRGPGGDQGPSHPAAVPSARRR